MVSHRGVVEQRSLVESVVHSPVPALTAGLAEQAPLWTETPLSGAGSTAGQAEQAPLWTEAPLARSQEAGTTMSPSRASLPLEGGQDMTVPRDGRPSSAPPVTAGFEHYQHEDYYAARNALPPLPVVVFKAKTADEALRHVTEVFDVNLSEYDHIEWLLSTGLVHPNGIEQTCRALGLPLKAAASPMMPIANTQQALAVENAPVQPPRREIDLLEALGPCLTTPRQAQATGEQARPLLPLSPPASAAGQVPPGLPEERRVRQLHEDAAPDRGRERRGALHDRDQERLHELHQLHAVERERHVQCFGGSQPRTAVPHYVIGSRGRNYRCQETSWSLAW